MLSLTQLRAYREKQQKIRAAIKAKEAAGLLPPRISVRPAQVCH